MPAVSAVLLLAWTGISVLSMSSTTRWGESIASAFAMSSGKKEAVLKVHPKWTNKSDPSSTRNLHPSRFPPAPNSIS